jgi:pyruvate dehydrogenase E1 component beta subunit
VPDGDHVVPLGKAAISRPGRDVTVVACRQWSARRCRPPRLAGEGIDIEIIDPRGIRPFDFDAVIESVCRTGRLVLAHEALVVGGPGPRSQPSWPSDALMHWKRRSDGSARRCAGSAEFVP